MAELSRELNNLGDVFQAIQFGRSLTATEQYRLAEGQKKVDALVTEYKIPIFKNLTNIAVMARNFAPIHVFETIQMAHDAALFRNLVETKPYRS